MISAAGLASASPEGGQPGSFLRQEVGARAAALGGAYGAIVDDASALYWNPAGLAALRKPELSATHIVLFQDTSYDFAAAGFPTQRWGGFAAGYLLQNSGGFERRSGPSDSPANFSISQSAFLAGWGAAFKTAIPLQVGASVKAVRESIDATSASGWGADLGLMARWSESGRLGLMVQNAVAPQVRFVSEPVRYAGAIEGSLAYDWGSTRGFNAVTALRVAKVDGQSAQASGGVELWRERLAALRFGMQEKGFSTGVGVRWGNAQFDYAVLLHDLGLSHQLSLRLAFGQTQEELEELIRRGIQKLTREEARRLARAYRVSAEKALEGGNYSKAVGDLEAAALWDPDDLSLNRRLGEVLAQVEESVNRQIIERTSLLAREQQGRGNLVASQSYWKSVLDVDPNNAEAQQALREIERAFGAREADAERMRQERRRQSAREAMLAAKNLADRGKFREALLQGQRAQRLYPEDPQVERGLRELQDRRTRTLDAKTQEGEAFMKAGEMGKALAAFDAVLAEDPENAEIRARLSEITQATKAPLSDEVRKQIEKKYYMAVDAYLKGRYEDAQARLGEIFALDPADENARKLKEKVEAALKISSP